MGHRIKLSSNEIRATNLNSNTVLDLIWDILQPQILKAFQLKHNAFLPHDLVFEWYFDDQRCEAIIVAYNDSYTIDEGLFRKIKTFEALDSFLSHPIEKVMYQSMLAPPFIVPNRLNKKKHCVFFAHLWKMIFSLFIKGYRPLKNNEFRIICLSRQAIAELLWEYFMANGDSIMGIPEEDSADVIFHMNIKGSFEKLIICAVNLNEFSIVDWDEVDNQIEQWESLNDWELLTLQIQKADEKTD